MEYVVVEKPAFQVAGFTNEFMVVDGGENKESIIVEWDQLSPEKMQAILSVANGAVAGFLGVSDEKHQETFNYTIGATTNEKVVSGLEVIEIPAATWLVFTSIGALPHAMWGVKEAVLKEWLLNSEYQQVDIPRIEVYPEGDMGSKDYQAELWVPVVAK